RFNANGSPDLTFDGDGRVTTAIGEVANATCITVQADGKILLGGYSSPTSGSAIIEFTMARYNPNGSPDLAFGVAGVVITPGTLFTFGQAIAVQTDGRILLVGGNLAPFPPNQGFVVARYLTNGKVDSSFAGDGVVNTIINTTNTTNDIAYGVKIQEDGKIVVSGTTTGSLIAAAVVRYRPNGNLDPSFGINGKVVIAGEGFGPLYKLQLYSNRIFVGGSSTFNSGFQMLALQNDALPLTCSNDTIAPTIIPKNTILFLDANGHATIQPIDVIQTITDNCLVRGSDISVTPNTFSCADVQTSTSIQSFSSTSSAGNQDFYGELGLKFTVGAAGLVITQLGAFDDVGNGIIGTQHGGVRVAIYNQSTKKIVDGLDVIVAGNADGFSGNYRFKHIKPVTVAPGDYLIVAKGYNLYEKNGNAEYGDETYLAGNSADGLITFSDSAYWGENTASGFDYPKYSKNFRQTPAYLAGSFKYVGASTDATDKIVTITARDISGNSSRVSAHVFVRYKGAACETPEPLTNIMNSFSLKNDMSHQEPSAITVFPNPSTGEFKVRFMVPESGKTTIQLQDEDGKMIK
ncbi:hypothetical protein EXU57_24365, partial [Segetibacter sp. 3557_3]